MESIIFTKELQDICVTETGTTVTFECEISKEGVPVEWYHGNKKLRRDDKHDIVAKGTTHHLTIEKCGGEDAGQYKAVYQTLETEAKLRVEGNRILCTLLDLKVYIDT